MISYHGWYLSAPEYGCQRSGTAEYWNPNGGGCPLEAYYSLEAAARCGFGSILHRVAMSDIVPPGERGGMCTSARVIRALDRECLWSIDIRSALSEYALRVVDTAETSLPTVSRWWRERVDRLREIAGRIGTGTECGPSAYRSGSDVPSSDAEYDAWRAAAAEHAPWLEDVSIALAKKEKVWVPDM